MFWLFGAGLLAGFVDGIAGGGGLITLPSLSLALGSGAHAIGTNKIAGTAASLIALMVYLRKGSHSWKNALLFSIFVGVGSVLGSRVTPYIPTSFFKYFLILICPVILFLIWHRALWENAKPQLSANPKVNFKTLGAVGLACGFYDGAFGPGGGTFMFLSLHWVAKLSLFTALITSKFANLCSAGTSLVSYYSMGYVHLKEGLWVGFGIAIGAGLGAAVASKHAIKIVRPMLALVMIILLIKIYLYN